MTPRVDAWLRQARNDLAFARHALQGGFHAQSCYSSEQAAEKALKGILIGLDREPARTHSLERLVEDLQATGVNIEELSHLRLNVLSRMITATRYPSGDEAPSELFDAQDARECLAMAEKVVAFAHNLAAE